ARDSAGKFLSGITYSRDCGSVTVLDEWRDVLGQVGEHAQWLGAGHTDDRAGPGRSWSGVRGDEVAGIDVARGDDAIEGRGDRFVLLIGDVLREGGLRLEHRGVGFIGHLRRDDLGVQEGLVALV